MLIWSQEGRIDLHLIEMYSMSFHEARKSSVSNGENDLSTKDREEMEGEEKGEEEQSQVWQTSNKPVDS